MKALACFREVVEWSEKSCMEALVKRMPGWRENRMGNEIKITEKNMISVIAGKGIGEIIQPLIREIHLFDTWIAGTTHLEDKSVLKQLRSGEDLILRRENNTFDSNAILVLSGEKQKLGYVPEKDNIVFSRLMDAGKILKAKINEIEDQGIWTKVSIGIYLVDL